ncbi:hypothetical protein DSO57_1032792 [Entomophthora muscae]|uniref:Uncharacterized protein n=1 Tax=Entomophthora muscae TaxID=34485 RepID=A0ACC2RR68_9FUNG|nr:hypothetical protein DSO57_1032792 [Entomophthora muscae]
MNSFAFFASILAQAISAMPTTSSMLDMEDMLDIPSMPPIPKMPKILISATIKDKKHYLLSNQQFKCDGNSRFTITLPNAQGRHAYLYPVVQKNQNIKLFKLTHGKYVKSKRNKKLSKGKNNGSKYRSVLAKYKIKKVSFTSNNKNPKYSVYIIPPKVSRRTAQGKSHKLNVDIQADFECRDKNNNIQRKVYNIPVAFTSNART